MNWDDLRFFLALARDKTASAAGRSLGVQHTTVARRICALEQQLGSRLFDRFKDGYELTAIGESLYPIVQHIEEQTQKLSITAFGKDSELSGKIKLTAPYFVLNILLLPRLKDFIDSYPNIDMEVLGSNDLADLTARQADIAIRMTLCPPDNLIGKKLLPLCHGIYASQKYLSDNTELHSLVLWENENEIPDWAQQHFPTAQVALRASDVMTVVTSVKNNYGIARLPCYIADAQKDLRRLPIELAPSEWGVWICNHSGLRSNARMRACKQFLSDIILEQKDLILGNNSQYFDWR